MTPTASATIPPDSRAAWLGWTIALGALSFVVTQGWLVPLDHLIAGWVAALRSPALDGPMHAMTWFGGSVWTIVGLAGLSYLAWRRGGQASALLMSGTFLIGAVMEIVLRLWVSQWRPDTMAIPEPLDPFTRFELAGFPSGHAFRSAFIFGWLAVGARGWRRPLCLVMIALVGFTRVYLNRHWATDVVGSWLVVLMTLAMARCWEEARASRRASAGG